MTIAAQITRHTDGTIGVLWEAMVASESGGAVNFPDFKLQSVQCFGNFDTSGTLAVRGSNAPADGGTFTTMEDVGSVAISFAAAGIFAVGADARWIKPVVTANGAGGAIDVDVYAIFVPRK